MIVNLTYLEQITDGDREMLLEMLDLFIRDIPIHMKKIQDSYSASNFEEIRREAHKMKPTLQYVGLTGMSEKIKELEQLAKSKENLNKLSNLIDELQDASNICVPALVAKKAELS